MNFIEKVQKAFNSGEKIPLKGHTKITLTDVKTGEKKVVEEDNIVTNAVANILSKNYSGLADYHLLMPLKKLFGGVMCFQNSINEDANNYLPPNDTNNPMVACAGDTAHSTASPFRGNPNGGETVVTDTSVKFVWDWATNQGNGTISTVCLCPANMGNIGLKPFDATQSLYRPCAVKNEAFAGNTTITRDVAMHFPISINSDGTEGKCIWWSGTDFEEITVKHDWLKYGIMRGNEDFVETAHRSCTVRNLPLLKSHITQDDDYYYCYAVVAYNEIEVTKISKDTFLTENIDLTINGVSLYYGDYHADMAQVNRMIPRYGSDGVLTYLPNGALTSYTGVNLTNGNSPLVCDGSVSINPTSNRTGTSNSPFYRPICIGQRPISGIIVGENYLINGSLCYPLAFSDDCVNDSGAKDGIIYDAISHGSAVWVSGLSRGLASARAGQGSILLPVFLSTINTLQAPIVKAATQTMKIEYTLTEA